MSFFKAKESEGDMTNAFCNVCKHFDFKGLRFELGYDGYCLNKTSKEGGGFELMNWDSHCPAFDGTLNKTKEEVYQDIIIREKAKKALDKNKEKITILQPGTYPLPGKLISEFADEIADAIKHEKIIFYRTQSKDIVEVCNIKIKKSEEEYLGFRVIKPNRFVTLSEKYTTPYILKPNNNGEPISINKSIGSELARTVLESPNLEENLFTIKRIFTVPLPILHNGKLTFPRRGYDERFNSWLPHDAPLISDPNMKLKEAKALLFEIYEDFCFKNKQDLTNAIASLLTPFLRGLYSHFNARTPVFFYTANRERAGKDYCAGITGIVYEGYPLEEPPISTTENKRSCNNDELRKKFLSVLISGRKRLHFSNNKGHINNASFEQFATAETFSDRVLGKSEVLTFDNEIELSLSGNVGISYTADFANRCRFVNLFLDIENANDRNFSRPDLHKWIKENRPKILSALYSLIRNWVEKKCPGHKNPFASYPQWANICGSVMVASDLGDPCELDKALIGDIGDNETKEMKLLFELCYEKYKDNEEKDLWITKSQVKNLIIEREEENIFGYFDFEKKADQIKFGKTFEKYVGRILSDIKLIPLSADCRPSRQKYKFEKV